MAEKIFLGFRRPQIDLTFDYEMDFVRKRNLHPPRSEERREVVDDFFENTAYLLEDMVQKYGDNQCFQLSDFTSDAMLTHRRCCDKFEGKKGSRYSSFLYRSIRNRFIDLVNKKSLENKYLEYDVPADLPLFETPLTIAASNENYERVFSEFQNAITSLNSGQREVAQLNLVDGIGLQEIAKMLGIKEETVRSRLFYSRKHLKTRMRHLLNS